MDLTEGLNIINLLKPRRFTWAMREESANNGKTDIGFIAQELDTVFEDLAKITVKKRHNIIFAKMNGVLKKMKFSHFQYKIGVGLRTYLCQIILCNQLSTVKDIPDILNNSIL